ncbi:acyltransferase [Mucilaginibacter sp. X5P1]|uniref:acyltransferase n=1 Tax=Mucilaginibacter sp. X5P1 TaxID=2723088 RepID=UPI0017EDFF50|nr:acyltransferase [Mucilaginibacter sp. X5P1]MBB6141212.1 acetyltransferase-like isoleucine patch superfamily enzyme [Mucilaginibacter sp. X5P1]
MKKRFKNILLAMLSNLCKLVAVFFSYSTANKWRSFKTKLHSLWIASEFKTFGKGIVIHYPINLLGGKYITIDSGVSIGKGAALTAWDTYKGYNYEPEISIGSNTSIGDDCHITAIHNIKIGNNVLMGKKVTITDNAHGEINAESFSLPPADRPLYSKGGVIIEDNVWIGDKVTILPDVKIGKNSIIGANALVTKDVPANCIAGGVPAVIIKQIGLK